MKIPELSQTSVITIAAVSGFTFLFSDEIIDTIIENLIPRQPEILKHKHIKNITKTVSGITLGAISLIVLNTLLSKK